MAKIHLHKEIGRRGRKYEVYINHTFYLFTNEGAAVDFLRGVDHYLQDQFELLNFNLINVYAISRKMSWYLSAYDNRGIRLQINDVENDIELTVSRCALPNYVSFSFDKLGGSIHTLQGILGRMNDVCKRKKYTVINAEIRAVSNAVNLQLEAALKFDYKNRKHKANIGKVINMPTHKSKFY